MRVMTWNLWWRFGDWEKRRRAIVETIGRVEPDVLCLQEAWTDGDLGSAELIADAFGFHAVTSTRTGRSDVGFTNAVVSRWPTTPVSDEALPGADGTPGHRRVVAGRVATPWGPWPVASTHLDHRFDASDVRERQVRRLLERAAEWRGDPAVDLPVIVGADVNAVPDSDEVRVLTGRRAGVDDIVFSDSWEQSGDGNGWTWRRDNPHAAESAWPNRRIDYVLVSWPRPKPIGNPVRSWLAGTEPVRVDGQPVWPSDHAALVVDITTPD